MKNRNIRKYIKSFLVCTLVGVFAYSCSDDVTPGNKEEDNEIVELSISLNSPNLDTKALTTRSAGDYTVEGYDADKKIYSLDVLIFKPSGELDKSITSISRVIENGDYKEITEIKGVQATAGERDIYVVANAPEGHFAGVNSFTDFKFLIEKLETQGEYPHPGVVPSVPGEDPIGGVDPSGLNTNLTMCGMVHASFNNQAAKHYLGYNTPDGLPVGITSGHALPGNGADGKTFYVDRLVARVAVKSIKFELPTQIRFDGVNNISKDNYTYQLDSVFMVNVRTTSIFVRETDNILKLAHGSKIGYDFLRPLLSNISAASELRTSLSEGIYSREYDITKNDYPLWFYIFENDHSVTYPTYLVVGVKYNFRNATNELKTVKSYYPVIINANGAANNADHNYIKRNYQYSLNITVRGLGYSSPIGNLKMSSEPLTQPSFVEVEETVGTNLFPWTGNIYKK